MGQKTNTELKTFFETGDIPTEAQFEDLIDTKINHGEAAVVSTAPNVTKVGFRSDNTPEGYFFSGGGISHYTKVNNFAPFDDYKGVCLGIVGTGNGNGGYHTPAEEGDITFSYEFFSEGGAVTFSLRVYSLTGSEVVQKSENITVDGYLKGSITATLPSGTTASRFRLFITNNSLTGKKLYLGRFGAHKGKLLNVDVKSSVAGGANSSSDVVPLDLLRNYRGYKYTDANTDLAIAGAGAMNMDFDASGIFGYKGKCIQYPPDTRNNHWLQINKDLIQIADGFVTFEWTSLQDTEFIARFYTVGASEVIVGSKNVFCPAGEVIRVTIPFTNADFANINSYLLRFFENGVGLDNKEYYLGRVQVTKEYSGLFENIDEASYTDFALAPLTGGGVTVDVNGLQGNITGNGRWLNGLHVGYGLQKDGFVNFENYPFEPSLIDAEPIFGYVGKAVQLVMPTTNPLPNFRYQVLRDKVALNKEVVDTGIVRGVMEVVSSINRTLLFRWHKRDGDGVETVTTGVTVALVANVPQTLETVITGVDVNDLTVLQLGIFSNFQNETLTIGRINIYGGNNANIIEFETDKYALFDAYRRNSNFFEDDNTILFLGDSLTAQGYDTYVQSRIGVGAIRRGFGGEVSYQIRDRFLAEPELHKYPAVIYVGRNNAKETLSDIDVLIADIQAITNKLTHGKFVVLMPPNGDYPTERLGQPRHANFLLIEERLQEIYGAQFFNSRRALIERWHYGGLKLEANYVQPALNANVTISISDNSTLSANDEIRVGTIGLADKYRVVSTSGANDVVVELLAADRIVVAGNVENPTNSAPSGYSATFKLGVFTETDYQDYADDTTPDSVRTDNIHLTAEGYEFFAELVSEKIQALNLVS